MLYAFKLQYLLDLLASQLIEIHDLRHLVALPHAERAHRNPPLLLPLSG
jgi:hypothetical protein